MQQHHRLWLYLALMLSILGAVISADWWIEHGSDSQTHAQAPALNRLYIVAGGFNTCGDFDRPEEHILAKAARWHVDSLDTRRGDQVDVLFSCFQGYDSTRILYRRGLNAPVQSTGWQQHEPLIEAIESYGPRERIVIGHSYGGWLAMKLAPQVNAKILVTLDPVSPMHCNQPKYLMNRALALFSAELQGGCNQFPADLDVAGLARAQHLQAWLHLYQDSYPYLHSGPLPDLGQVTSQAKSAIVRSVKLALTNDQHFFGGAHLEITGDDQAWRRIAGFIKSFTKLRD